MRKIFLVLIIGLGLCNKPAIAQYTKLVDFQGLNGGNPQGSLVLADEALYGTVYYGGANNTGYIFKVNTDGSGYRAIHDFNVSDGCFPQGSLILSDDVLYGMATGGGANNNGCIYKIDTTGNGFSDIYDFNSTDGRYPLGSLALSEDTLYGMTYYGGLNDLGCVFKIRNDGTGYKKLLDFNGTISGSYPWGSLVISEGVLYGMTLYGGLNDKGCIFKIKKDGSSYSKLLDFDGWNNGSYPYGSLTISGDTLYGMTFAGGSSNGGCIFSIHTDGTGYSRRMDFPSLEGNGYSPYGSLTLVEHTLYGMTYNGGDHSLGTIFQFDLDNNEYSDLWSFDSIDGYHPYGDVTIKNDIIYGMTCDGGNFDAGVVFRYLSGPDTQTSDITFPFVGNSVANISWTKGNGEKRALFVKEGAGTISNPENNTTYTASSDWNSKGTQLGTSGYYCVYNDTGTIVLITNLTTGTTYTIQAYEYNGEAGSELYLLDTETGNPNTFQTESIDALQTNHDNLVMIYTEGNDIYAMIEYCDRKALLAIYSLSGICITQTDNLTIGQNKITGNYCQGVYVVRLVLDDKLYLQKIIIK